MDLQVNIGLIPFDLGANAVLVLSSALGLMSDNEGVWSRAYGVRNPLLRVIVTAQILRYFGWSVPIGIRRDMAVLLGGLTGDDSSSLVDAARVFLLGEIRSMDQEAYARTLDLVHHESCQHEESERVRVGWRILLDCLKEQRGDGSEVSDPDTALIAGLIAMQTARGEGSV